MNRSLYQVLDVSHFDQTTATLLDQPTVRRIKSRQSTHNNQQQNFDFHSDLFSSIHSNNHLIIRSTRQQFAFSNYTKDDDGSDVSNELLEHDISYWHNNSTKPSSVRESSLLITTTTSNVLNDTFDHYYDLTTESLPSDLTKLLESSSSYLFSTSIYPSLNESTTINSTAHQVTTIVLEPDLRIHYPVLACFLSLICVVVVFGNGLTMLSICKERYLRTVTNYFVASLAFADCLVGAIVMPFSIVHEVMNKWWILGQDWCDLWHSFDVLASTASILNLCVISLDRYWAITDPMTYPSRMTPKKAFIFILSLWLCSALISFPAIVWWRAVQKPVEPYRCTFTDDVGYLVFSSIISFYGPLTVMVYTYYRIYVVASEQNRSLKLGVKQIEMSYIGENASGAAAHYPMINSEYRAGFTLRMHRGGGAGSSIAVPRYSTTSGMHFHHRDSTDSTKCNSTKDNDIMRSKDSSSTSNVPAHNHPRQYDEICRKDRPSEDLSSFNDANDNINNDPESLAGIYPHHHQRRENNQIQHHQKMTNWSVGRRLTKLAKERKAAKTLGIVMGVFILCWLPFFVTNILMGICPESCILQPDLIFSIVTWLGWINSAMNPIIYACWSKDFRRAFRKLLCSCFMKNSTLSYNRNRIYKAQMAHAAATLGASARNNRQHYNYNFYYKSKIKNRKQSQPQEESDFHPNVPKTRDNICQNRPCTMERNKKNVDDSLSASKKKLTIDQKQQSNESSKSNKSLTYHQSELHCHHRIHSGSSLVQTPTRLKQTNSLKCSIDQIASGIGSGIDSENHHQMVTNNINLRQQENLEKSRNGNRKNLKNPKMKKSSSFSLLLQQHQQPKNGDNGKIYNNHPSPKDNDHCCKTETVENVYCASRNRFNNRCCSPTIVTYSCSNEMEQQRTRFSTINRTNHHHQPTVKIKFVASDDDDGGRTISTNNSSSSNHSAGSYEISDVFTKIKTNDNNISDNQISVDIENIEYPTVISDSTESSTQESS